MPIENSYGSNSRRIFIRVLIIIELYNIVRVFEAYDSLFNCDIISNNEMGSFSASMELQIGVLGRLIIDKIIFQSFTYSSYMLKFCISICTFSLSAGRSLITYQIFEGLPI